MNRYEEKQQARRAGYEARADKAEQASNAACKASRDATKGIVIGQPILVGHHSESRHRAAIARSNRLMRKACDESDKAEHYKRKAAAVGTGGISSDDPAALDKLRAELASVEAAQVRMKAANKAIRAGKTADKQIPALVALGFSEADAAGLLTPDYAGRVGFPAYSLTNNNANGTRIKKRIAELEARSSRELVEAEGEGYSYREDAGENRVMFIFDGKPAEDVRKVLRSHAFIWSPSRGAWVRQLNNAGIYAGKCVREKLVGLEKK